MTNYWSMNIAAGSLTAPVAKRQRREVGGSPTSTIAEASLPLDGHQSTFSKQPYTCRGLSAWQSVGRRRSCTSTTHTSARVQPFNAASRRSTSSNGAEFVAEEVEQVETSTGPSTPNHAVAGTRRRQLRGFQKRREERRQTGASAVPPLFPSAGVAAAIAVPASPRLFGVRGRTGPMFPPHLCCWCCCFSIPHTVHPPPLSRHPLVLRTLPRVVSLPQPRGGCHLGRRHCDHLSGSSAESHADAHVHQRAGARGGGCRRCGDQRRRRSDSCARSLRWGARRRRRRGGGR